MFLKDNFKINLKISIQKITFNLIFFSNCHIYSKILFKLLYFQK